MSDAFDPYHRWLGVAPEEQPANHYRLLGLKLYEGDVDVIESAADKQMAHVRNFQAGEHADEAQRLLNEIAAAKLVLLREAKKRDYDAQLKAMLDPGLPARPQEQPPHRPQAYDAALQAPLDAAAPIFEELAPDERPLAHPAPLHPIASALPRAQRPLSVATPLASPVAAANEITLRGPSGQRPSPMAVRRRSNSSLILVAGGAVALVLLAVVAAIVFSKADDDELAAQDPSTNTGVESTASGNTSGKNNLDQAPAAIPPRDPRPASNPPERIADPVDEPAKEPIVIVVKPKPPQELPVLPPQQPAKLPVPERPEREAKRQEILAIFPIAAARTPDAKNQLATKLIATARVSQADAAAQFALLNLAREQAAEVGNIKIAFEAIDGLAEKFDLDADALRIDALQQGSKATMPPEAKRDLVVTGMDLVEQLAAADKFDEADALSERMLTFARPLRDNEFTKSIVERRRALSDQAVTYRRVQAAFDTLKKSPDDPEANLAVGRYLTFVKQDWDAGLEHLAKSSDAALAAAASAELASPQTPADQEKLADMWWAAAEAEKDPKLQSLGRARAVHWYRQIVDELVGLAKTKAEQRIEAAGASRIDLARGLVAHWKFDEGKGTVARDSVGGHDGTIRGATWTKGIRGSALNFDGTNDIVVMGNPDELNFTGEITISVCIRTQSWPPRYETRHGLRYIVAHGFVRNPLRELSVLQITHKSDVTTFYRVDALDGVKSSKVQATAPSDEVGIWNHLVFVYDGTSWHYYRNGTLVATERSLVGASLMAGNWAIGGHSGGDPRYFHGDIDDVRIYNRGLSADEVRALYLGKSTTASAAR